MSTDNRTKTTRAASDMALRFLRMSLCLTLALTGSAFAQQEKPEGDLKTIQGVWVSTGKDAAQESHWTFEGNKLTLKTPTRNYRMEIELVPTKDPEKAINFRVADNSPSAPGSFVKGIYRFNEKDSLELAISDQEGKRPTSFKTDPGGTIDGDFLVRCK